MPPVHTLDAASAATVPVTGFLRGVERRAALLAELQCGDPEQGDRALEAAIQTFAQTCDAGDESGWPLRFWTALLQAPTLNVEAVAPFWDGDFAPLARLDFGPRAVLLLRVVAGLDDSLAAEVFGVEVGEFKQALQGALPQREDGSLDGEAWLAMHDEARYRLVIERWTPPAERVIAFVRQHGERSMYESVDQRRACCALRKLEPLSRLLAGRTAWITGIRRAQSAARGDVPFEEIERAESGANGSSGSRVKVNPLADWSDADVWLYIGEHGVPYNPLHDRFYPSIGCAPCTRAVEPGEDVRAGRWWWEDPATKECGLHPAKRSKEAA